MHASVLQEQHGSLSYLFVVIPMIMDENNLWNREWIRWQPTTILVYTDYSDSMSVTTVYDVHDGVDYIYEREVSGAIYIWIYRADRAGMAVANVLALL